MRVQTLLLEAETLQRQRNVIKDTAEVKKAAFLLVDLLWCIQCGDVDSAGSSGW